MLSGKKDKKNPKPEPEAKQIPKTSLHPILGARLARLRAMLAHLGSAWGHLRGYVGPSSSYVGPFRGYVGPACARFAAYVGPCCPILIHKIEKMGKPQNKVNCGRFVGSAAGLATPLSYHVAMPRPREKGQHGTMAKVILTTYQHPKVTFTIGLYRFIHVLACVVFVEATCSY